MQTARNIVLIGMPGAGKTTLGRRLAERLDKTFLDTDVLLERHLACSLQAAVDSRGYEFLRANEAQVLASLDPENAVIATGGSAVYASEAIEHVIRQAYCVYLYCTLEQIKQRVGNFATRGLARPASQSLEALFKEREPLYQRYADCVIETKDESEVETLSRMLKELSQVQRDRR